MQISRYVASLSTFTINEASPQHLFSISWRQGVVILHEKVKCLNTVVFMPCSSKYNKDIGVFCMVPSPSRIASLNSSRSDPRDIVSLAYSKTCSVVPASVIFFSTLWRKQHRPSGYTVSLQNKLQLPIGHHMQDKIFVDNSFMSLSPFG